MKGIKCTSSEVNGFLAGDKSQIRLVIKPQPEYETLKFAMLDLPKCPHQIGDLVFVKESFLVFVKESFEEWDDGLVYKADNSLANTVSKWKSAQHMKQEQSRITLRIKDISVERLQDISEEDCAKEGFEGGYNDSAPSGGSTGYSEFAEHWNATHKKPEEKWEANPWIWKIGFDVVNNFTCLGCNESHYQIQKLQEENRKLKEVLKQINECNFNERE
jgi:hypothetical protein